MEEERSWAHQSSGYFGIFGSIDRGESEHSWSTAVKSCFYYGNSKRITHRTLYSLPVIYYNPPPSTRVDLIARVHGFTLANKDTIHILAATPDPTHCPCHTTRKVQVQYWMCFGFGFALLLFWICLGRIEARPQFDLWAWDTHLFLSCPNSEPAKRERANSCNISHTPCRAKEPSWRRPVLLPSWLRASEPVPSCQVSSRCVV